MSRWTKAGPTRTLITLAMALVALVGAARPGTAAQGEDADGALGADSRTVNVELVFDASGSMAELIAGTDESKIEAARRAITGVIDRIPEREGFNVGFRVYGHEGSNREEDRALSCRSTELLVPMAGVDEAALREQAAAFAPTGWTPLALALEEAGQDFDPGGERVANAVVLVTDGEETCGGDPCAVARELNAAEIGLTTHVVGFALTPAQRGAVRCIAEEGGGRLFAAEDADELSAAVFAAIQEVAAAEAAAGPVEGELEVGGFVGGNAFGLLEPCEAGELAVIATGPYEEGIGLPVVACNGTDEAVQAVEVGATAREADGGLIGSGASLDLDPYVVEADGVAFGHVYFGSGELPVDTAFDDFAVAGQPVDAEDALRFDLVVEEINVREGEIVGGLRSEQAAAVSVVGAWLACFDGEGALLGIAATLPGGGVGPGERVTFSFRVGSAAEGADACPAFLVAGGGIEGF